VVAQSPAPDARFADGTIIKLTVSQGPKKPTDNTDKLKMPDLRGRTLKQALAALKEVGITDPTINRTTANRPGSVVLDQDLSAETLVRPGQKVTLKFGKPR
jgi:beta-lactam-binding protein with PASTA domain